MVKTIKVISEAQSFQGFNILIFLKNNKVKLLAILIAVLGSLTTEYPQLGVSLSGFLIMAEQLYKFWNKEIKEQIQI